MKEEMARARKESAKIQSLKKLRAELMDEFFGLCEEERERELEEKVSMWKYKIRQKKDQMNVIGGNKVFPVPSSNQ